MSEVWRFSWELTETAIAERLDALLELRERVDTLEAAESSKGFGRE